MSDFRRRSSRRQKSVPPDAGVVRPPEQTSSMETTTLTAAVENSSSSPPEKSASPASSSTRDFSVLKSNSSSSSSEHEDDIAVDKKTSPTVDSPHDGNDAAKPHLCTLEELPAALAPSPAGSMAKVILNALTAGLEQANPLQNGIKSVANIGIHAIAAKHVAPAMAEQVTGQTDAKNKLVTNSALDGAVLANGEAAHDTGAKNQGVLFLGKRDQTSMVQAEKKSIVQGLLGNFSKDAVDLITRSLSILATAQQRNSNSHLNQLNPKVVGASTAKPVVGGSTENPWLVVESTENPTKSNTTSVPQSGVGNGLYDIVCTGVVSKPIDLNPSHTEKGKCIEGASVSAPASASTEQNQAKTSSETYADKLKGNKSGVDGLNMSGFRFDGANTEINEQGVFITKVYARTSKEPSKCLIGYISGKYPGRDAIKLVVDKWKAPCTFSRHSSGWIIFQFMDPDHMQRVLSEGPYQVYGMALVLKRMPPFFDFSRKAITTIPLWVQLPHLPLDLWDSEYLFYICSYLGKPLFTDKVTSNQDLLMVNFARCMVEIDISKTVPKSIPWHLPDNIYIAQTVCVEDCLFSVVSAV